MVLVYVSTFVLSIFVNISVDNQGKNCDKTYNDSISKHVTTYRASINRNTNL